MFRSLLRPSLLLACVVASGCGPAPEPTPAPEGAVTQSLRWPRWLKIVGADLVGGLQGALTGAEIGSAIPGVGTTAGAIGGAIVGGAQASVEAAARNTTTQGVPAGSTLRGDASNASNPFDHVGKLHNAALDTAVGIIGPGGCIPNPFPFPFPRDRTQGPIWDLTLKGANTPPQLLESAAFKASWHDTLDFTAAAADQDIEVAIRDRVKSGKISQAVGDWAIHYFNTVAPLDTTQMVEVTRSFEKDVQADKKLAEAERNSLLSAFSIARHSAAYWADQASRSNSPWRSCGK